MTTKIPTLSSSTSKGATKKVVPGKGVRASSSQVADFYLEMGALIGNYRRAGGLTQQELADRIGMTRGSVTNIEGGIQTPLPKTLSEIADALKIGVDKLFPASEMAAEEYRKTLKSLAPEARETIERYRGRQ